MQASRKNTKPASRYKQSGNGFPHKFSYHSALFTGLESLVQEFIPGQRWLNDAELDLGLGTVLATEQRTVTILFPACDETRTYAKQSAPLVRARFNAGDTVHSNAGVRILVSEVREEHGLLRYIGTDETGGHIELGEGQLDHFIPLNKAAERLLAGRIDADKWFELRYRTRLEASRLARSALRGLSGGRTSLIPHQLYIAHEVASRYAPRVLLADEVGLGKTIEAGLILHQQLLSGRAGRVLILVPETLLHQWLVEMLRRFNLYFSIFDEERCAALLKHSPDDNPFHSEQLVLCSLKFLRNHPVQLAHAIKGEWDLLVVDEAHHLKWQTKKSGKEYASREYRIVAQLAQHSKGVLLLTATPEQLGKAGHFARLRLLDPNRFFDFEDFIREEQGYESVVQIVEQLLNEKKPDEQALAALGKALTEESRALLAAAQQDEQAQKQLIEQLVDRHGTGRVLFRNTRATIKGFPARKAWGYPLTAPAAYRKPSMEKNR